MATAKKWQLERTTLAKRFKGQTRSIETYRSESSRRLNNAQEEELIGYIDKLTLRGLPPTPQIVCNLAEEIVAGPIGINWHANFVTRHRDRLSSAYLRNIDHARKKADNSYRFQHYYDLDNCNPYGMPARSEFRIWFNADGGKIIRR